MRPTRHRRLDLILQGLRAAEIQDATYMACPITSGYRELSLMLDLGVTDRTDLRRRHSRRWRAEVFDANVADARAVAHTIRARSGKPVIDPTHFEAPGLTQDDYDALCGAVIKGHVREVALAPGWQYSRGARLEVKLALSQGKSITDVYGRAMASALLRDCAADADTTIRRMGLCSENGKLLPLLDIEADILDSPKAPISEEISLRST